MRLAEIILRWLAKDPDTTDDDKNDGCSVSGDELSLLRREYTNFSSIVRGKRVVDFGCGEGKQTIALKKEEGCFVCGLDTNEKTLNGAKKLASDKGVDESNAIFCKTVPNEMEESFDVVISQNAMEHYPDPVFILNEMKRLINKGGKILITFGPPWFAPYGSHMYYFCKVPWINVLFSEKTVMCVRSLYRKDGAKRYEEVESGLNKMTIRKFEKILGESGLHVEYTKYTCIKGTNWLVKIPFVREFIINHVTYMLSQS